MNLTGNQAVSFLSIALFRWAIPVSHSSFRSTDHLNPKKEQLRKIAALFCFLHSQSSHAVSIHSSGLTIQHTASFRCSAFSSIIVFRPLLIWWLRFLSAIKVSSLRLLQIKERLKAAFNIFLDVSRYYPFIPFRKSYISFSV